MGKFFAKRGVLMHRRFSRRQRLFLAPLAGALAIAAFPAVAEAATPATACTAVPASDPCYTAAPAIVPPAGAPAGEVSSPKVGIFLQVNPGTWTPPQPYPSVQWTQDCNLTAVPASLGTPIPGAINRTYQISDSDAGHTLCVIFDTGGVETILGPTGTVAAVSAIPQSNGAPTISGPHRAGADVDGHPRAVARDWSHDRRHHVQVSVEALQQHRRCMWQDVHPAELVAHLCTAGGRRRPHHAGPGHRDQCGRQHHGGSEEGDIRGHAAQLRAAPGQPLRAGRKQQPRRPGWRPEWRAERRAERRAGRAGRRLLGAATPRRSAPCWRMRWQCMARERGFTRC